MFFFQYTAGYRGVSIDTPRPLPENTSRKSPSRPGGPLKISVLLAACLSSAAGASPSSTAPVFAEVPPVVVTGTRLGVSWTETDRQVMVIGRERLESAPQPSIASSLAAAGADVQSRGPLGIQSDLGLRGGTFQQTLVLVDGFRCNDPQTGHHNMDIPFPLEALDRIEVVNGPASSAHGADAFGGTVNLVTRKPEETFISGRLAGGGFGTASAALTAGGTTGGLGEIFSLEGARTDGFMRDRDSLSGSASSRSTITTPAGSTSVLLGINRKDFGAYDFYTPGLGYASREWTRTYFSGLTQNIPVGGALVSLSGSFHRHDDRFLLDEDIPGMTENVHQTRIWTGSAQISGKPVDQLSMAVGAEAAGDGMESSTLGDHWRPRQGLFGEANYEIVNGLNILGGLRHDRTAGTGTYSPSGGASWWATKYSRLRLHTAKSFRIPSFTELYYSDKKKTNTGNPGLLPEEAVSYEAGVDFLAPNQTTVSFTAYQRRQQETIDWIGPTRKGPWRAVNSEDMRFTGTETTVRTALGTGEISAGFSQSWSRYSLDAYSKYALTYPDRTWKAGITSPRFMGMVASAGFQYRHRRFGDETTLLDCRIARQFGNLTAYVEGTNLLDRKYEDPVGVAQPGLWLGGGIKFSWTPRTSAASN
jgi:iron complex outermembrane receptor protein